VSRASDLAKIREVLAKTTAGEGSKWFVQHGATEDGLSVIDDGRCDSGMHGVYGEAHDIELAAACVNFVTLHVLKIQE